MNQPKKFESPGSAVPDNESRRELKRKRYETGDYGESYDSRYSSGLNELNTLVERRWIASHLEGNRILDAGAGTGRLSAYLAGKGLNVVALDSSQPMLDTLRRKAPAVCAVRSDLYRLPLEKNSFDSAVCLHVLFHLTDWPEALAELARVVKPGGAVIFEMRSGEHVRLAEKILRLFGLSRPDRDSSSPELATVYAGREEVRRAMDKAGLALEKTLSYDLGHSYYLSPMASRLEPLFERFDRLRNTAAACELLIGRWLPPSLTYRTLCLGRKKS